MKLHSVSWHERQLAHVRDCLAEADKQHTEQELADAWAALMKPTKEIQPGLFNTGPRGAVQ
jgi:hypothetical protein